MTEYFLGKRSYAAIAKESVYGTVNTATNWAYPGKVQRFTPNDKQNYDPLGGMDTVDPTRIVNEYYPKVPTFGGTLETLIQHGRLMAMGIGTDTVTGTGGSYTHTIAISNQLSSFDLDVGYHHGTMNFGKRYTGCKFDRTEVNFGKGDWIRLTQDFIAQKAAKITSFKAYQTVVDSQKKYTTTQIRPYRSSDATFTINNVDVSADVTQARLTFNNQLQVDEAMNQSVGEFIAEPVPGIANINASLTLKMSKSALYDLYATGSKISNCSFKVTRGSNSITWAFGGTWLESANSEINIGDGIVIQECPILIGEGMTITEVNTIQTDYDTVEV